MPAIESRLKDLLDETRLTMLGTQVLMGLQYNAAFSQRFGRLPVFCRWLDGVALLLILTTVAVLLAVPTYHQIAEQGHATGRMLNRASGNLKIAFLPLALALGMDVSIALEGSIGPWASGVGGPAFVLSAVLLWYALPMWCRGKRQGDEAVEDKKQSLETRIEQAMTELRIVLPGAQALFGFQFAAILTAKFEGLAPVLKDMHVASLCLVGTAIVMLIAPAAYHRIAAGGNAEEGVLRYAVGLMLPAQGFLVLGLIGDAYITMQMAFGSQVLSSAVAVGALVAFTGLLYLVPLAARSRRAAGGSLRDRHKAIGR